MADLIAEQPDAARAESLRELEPVLTAIELLLDAGAFERADELYQQRLGHSAIFKWLPAPHAGLQCELGFVADADQRRQVVTDSTSMRSLFKRYFGAAPRVAAGGLRSWEGAGETPPNETPKDIHNMPYFNKSMGII